MNYNSEKKTGDIYDALQDSNRIQRVMISLSVHKRKLQKKWCCGYCKENEILMES